MKTILKPIWEFFMFFAIILDEDRRSDLDGYHERKARKKAERRARWERR